MDRLKKWLKTRNEPTAGTSVEQALAQVRAESGIDFKRARARAGFARGHLLDVTLQLPGGTGSQAEQEAADDLLCHLLGELTVERWLSSVTVVPAPRGGPLVVVKSEPDETASIALAELVQAVAAARRGLYDGLPEQPYSRAPEAANWLMFELSPEPAHDYAAQDDLAICTTSVPELKKSFLRGEPFFSGRFSKHGELFAYLKYQGEADESGERLAERSKLESALEHALRPQLGALVGAGFGLRYGYLDLALSDPERAIAELPELLRKLPAPKSCWLLFCDSELERQYLPIWPGSAPPFFG